MALAVVSLGTAGAIGLLSLSQGTPLAALLWTYQFSAGGHRGNRSGDSHIEFRERMIGTRAHFQGPDVKH